MKSYLYKTQTSTYPLILQKEKKRKPDPHIWSCVGSIFLLITSSSHFDRHTLNLLLSPPLGLSWNSLSPGDSFPYKQFSRTDCSHSLSSLSFTPFDYTVICCRMTNYHRLSNFKQHPFIMSSQLCGQPSRGAWLGSLLSASQAEVKVLARLSSFLEVLQAHPGCWQNSVPCGWLELRSSFSCWLTGGDNSISREFSRVLYEPRYIFKASKGSPLHTLNLSDFHFCYFLGKILCF